MEKLKFKCECCGSEIFLGVDEYPNNYILPSYWGWNSYTIFCNCWYCGKNTSHNCIVKKYN